MRLDKYLKVSRLIKRRSVATEVCKQDRILVNGKEAKPSKDIKENDIITLIFGRKIIEVKVLSIKEVIKKEEASNMYELIKETEVKENN